RAVADAGRAEEGGGSPTADRHASEESKCAGGLGLGSSNGICGARGNSPIASVCAWLYEHWLRAVHGNSRGWNGRPQWKVGREEAGVRHPYLFGEELALASLPLAL